MNLNEQYEQIHLKVLEKVRPKNDEKQLLEEIYRDVVQKIKTILDKKKIKAHFIGDYDGEEYYLIFKEKNNNLLTKSFLNKINKNQKKKVIYADKCLIADEDLKKRNLIFKQIPYEVERY